MKILFCILHGAYIDDEHESTQKIIQLTAPILYPPWCLHWRRAWGCTGDHTANCSYSVSSMVLTLTTSMRVPIICYLLLFCILLGAYIDDEHEGAQEIIFLWLTTHILYPPWCLHWRRAWGRPGEHTPPPCPGRRGGEARTSWWSYARAGSPGCTAVCTIRNKFSFICKHVYCLQYYCTVN